MRAEFSVGRWGKIGVVVIKNVMKILFGMNKGLDCYIQPLDFLWRAREDSNPRPIA